MENSISRTMMSDEIKDSVQDIEITETMERSFMIATLTIIDDKTTKVFVGSVVSYFTGEQHEIDVRVLLSEAFSFVKQFTNSKFMALKELEFDLGEDTIIIKDELRVVSTSIQDIDPQRQTCVLTMKLLKSQILA